MSEGLDHTEVEAAAREPEAADASAPEPERRRRWPSLWYIAQATLVVLVVVSIYDAASDVSQTLVIVVIALVIAVGLDPAVRWLVSRGLRRGLAIATIFLTAFLILALFVALVGPPLVRQVTALSDDIPRYVSDLAKRNDWIGRYVREHDVATSVKDFVADLPSRVAESFGTIVGFAGRIGSGFFQLATLAILSIYFALSLDDMRRSAGLLFPSNRRAQARRVLDRAVEKIGGYVAGNLATSGVCAVLALIALLIIGVPFPVPLALWAGIADLIPQVGSYLGAAPAVIVAFFQSPILALIVVAYFIVYQQFENYWLVPRVMKNAIDLSPATVIVSTLIGGGLLGLAGALLALPVAATLKVLIQELWLKDRIDAEDQQPREGVEPSADTSRREPEPPERRDEMDQPRERA